MLQVLYLVMAKARLQQQLVLHRCLGAGKKVYFSQFMKTLSYSEQIILQQFSPNLTLKNEW